jgi:hypothetical protein
MTQKSGYWNIKFLLENPLLNPVGGVQSAMVPVENSRLRSSTLARWIANQNEKLGHEITVLEAKYVMLRGEK